MAIKRCRLLLFGFLLFVVLTDYSCAETDTLLQGQELGDAGHLVSAFGTFTLGFLDNHLSVWYTKRPEPGSYDRVIYGQQYVYRRRNYGKRVWDASLNNPVQNGQLLIGADGNLKILNRGEDPISITSAQVSAGCNTSATLQEDGNFVLRELNKDGSVRRLLWQSFDYPTNTFLPGMKIGMNLQTGHRWVATSGSFSFGMDPNETRQLVVWWKGEVYWRSGVLADGHFNMSDELLLRYFSIENERYFSYNGLSSSPALIIDNYGSLRTFDETLVSCEGSYDYDKYYGESFSAGCMPAPRCRTGTPSEVYFPESSPLGVYKIKGSVSMNRYDCYQFCLRNCSCVAYEWIDHSGDYDCQIWSREALRLGAHTSEKRPLALFIGLGVGGAVLICISCFGLWIYKHPDIILNCVRMQLMALITNLTMAWRECRERGSRILLSMMVTNTEQEILLSELGIDEMNNHCHGGKRNQELQFFSLETIKMATENFASLNKLGEGGFGSVYKGKLPGGQEVAIKRLSTNSRQGMVEFKNEIKVIAKLQHNNLVRLVGCCLEKGEKILIYEYMPNKSLDFFLFDEANRCELNWGRRFKIVEGIAQGLLYLHKYSRLKIIHRDLKAGNILLDSEMNPKISDFGMAKIFGTEESKANTNRVVGTYGYMPPEYAIDGIFSTKSDVFSFGVLLLEIVSGRRNNSFHHSDGPLSLIVYAWEMWTLDRVVELIDPTIEERHHKEAIRCIRIGLLCVQENPIDRPNMLDVASMLYNEATELRSPNQPAFYNRKNLQEQNFAGYSPGNLSQNEVTITELEGR